MWPLGLQYFLDGGADADRPWKIGPLERVRVRRVEAGRALHRGFEMIEAALLHQGRKLRAEAVGAGRFVNDDAATGLLHRFLNRLDVEWHDSSQVDDLGVDPQLTYGG